MIFLSHEYKKLEGDRVGGILNHILFGPKVVNYTVFRRIVFETCFSRNILFFCFIFPEFRLNVPIMYKECLCRTVQLVILGKKSRHNTHNFHPVFIKLIQHVLLLIPPRFHFSICSFIKEIYSHQ